jgi:hypothetical protein
VCLDNADVVRDVSTLIDISAGVVSGFSRTRMRFQQSNCGIKRRRTQVHVALRCPELLVTRQLLDRSRRRAAHRQM